MIMLAAERMKGLTGEVRRSTREQTKVGNFIAQSTESITTMIQQIKNATDEQRRSSEQIVHAVKDIEKSTEINISAARSLGESVAGLSRQTEVFQKELSGYKV
jgi:methyl-accepting chemotaxis protein